MRNVLGSAATVPPRPTPRQARVEGPRWFRTVDDGGHRPVLLALPHGVVRARAPGGVAAHDGIRWWVPVDREQVVVLHAPEPVVRAAGVAHLVLDAGHHTFAITAEGLLVGRRGAVGADLRLGGRGVGRHLVGQTSALPEGARRSPHLAVAPVGHAVVWSDGGFAYRLDPTHRDAPLVLGPAGRHDRLVVGPFGAVLRGRDGRALWSAGPAGRLVPLAHPLPIDATLRFSDDGLVAWALDRGRAVEANLSSGRVRRRRRLPIGDGWWEDRDDGEITDRDDRVIEPPGAWQPTLDGDRQLVGVRGGVVDLKSGAWSGTPRLLGRCAARLAEGVVWLDEQGHGVLIRPDGRVAIHLPLGGTDRLARLVPEGTRRVIAVTDSGRLWRITRSGRVRPHAPPLSEPNTAAAPSALAALGFTHGVARAGRVTAWAEDGRVARVPAPTRR